MDKTLPKSMRLSDPAAVQRVFDEQTLCCRTPFFVLIAKPNQLAIPRLAILVAKKKVRLSTQRTWIRRLVRESFRAHKAAVLGFDLVAIFKAGLSPAALKKERHLIQDKMDELWIKLCTTSKSCVKK